MESGLEMRPATAGDAAACAGIFNDWVDATPWMPRVHPPDDVARHYAEHVVATLDVTVVEREGRVVGFMALAPGWIEQLYLSPGARGLGAGSTLVAAAKRAHPEGLRLWTFVANGPAREFYARRGFEEIRRTGGENEEGLPDVLLGWAP